MKRISTHTIAAFTLATVTASFTLASAQNGPGGVGSTDGTSSLALWLVGDNGTFQSAAGSTTASANNDPVGRWEDRSGNGRNVTQATTARLPALHTSALNGHATLLFDNTTSGSEDFLRSATISPALAQPLTLFAVALKSGSGSTAQTIIDSRTAGTNTMVLGYSGTSQARINAGSDVTINVTQSSATIYRGVFNGTSSSIAVNGGSPATGSAGTRTADGFTVGGNRSTAQFLNGEIAELLVYGADLIAAEKTIVENYLAAKYAITVGTAVYSSTTYTSDVAGIGRESDGTHSLSASGGMVVADNGALNASGEYLLVGHDGTVNDTVTLDLPTDIASRWRRIWFVDKTGTLDGANVRIAFDYGDAGLPIPFATPGHYHLLRRSGTSGTFTEVPTADAMVSGDQVIFEIADANLTDGYYTLGIGIQDHALPVEMALFTATATGEGIDLSWRTASEVDNAGFLISRRAPGGTFTMIASYRTAADLIGAGTTPIGRSYRWIDRDRLEPGSLYEYRLQSAHADGSLDPEEYVRTVTLSADDGNETVPLFASLGQSYPAPCAQHVTIPFMLPAAQHVELLLFDDLGRAIITLSGDGARGPNRMEIDLSGLDPGLYYYRLRAGRLLPARPLMLIR